MRVTIYYVMCVSILASCSFAASAPSDVRVAPLVTTTWGQTTVNSNACFNYYTPGSGYPPVVAGSASNYPAGCVATGMAQVMNYNQWGRPMFPFGTSFTIWVDGTQYPIPPASLTIMGGTGVSGQYNWPLLATNLADPVNVIARQEAGYLLHDLGLALSMSYTSAGSGTDFEFIDGAFAGFGYSRAVTIEGNNYVNGVLSPLNIPAATAELAITTNLDAGLPVMIGVNTQNLQNGHVLVIDGYGYNAVGTAYFHYNFGLPVLGTYPPATNLGWFTLPGVGTTNDSAGYPVLDGVAFNIFKAVTLPAPMGEIISGRIMDASGTPLNGIQVDITSMNPMFIPVTVFTNAQGIFAYYDTISSNQQYTVTASGVGYQSQSKVCTTGLSQKQWIVTNNPAPGDGYYNNTVGNVRADMTLVPGITLPPIPVCDLAEFAGFSQYYQTYHSQITAPDIRYDYTGDWNVDMQDLVRITQAWLMMPVEFRTDFAIGFDVPGPMPANYPWQYAGTGTWSVVSTPVPAAESPAITHNQSTSFKLPVKIYPGMLGNVDIMFELSCDTEMGADVFEFLVDGVVQTEMGGMSAFSGNTPPQMMMYPLTGVTSPVVKTLEWRYTKDAANSMGLDKVWIGNITVHAHP